MKVNTTAADFPNKSQTCERRENAAAALGGSGSRNIADDVNRRSSALTAGAN